MLTEENKDEARTITDSGKPVRRRLETPTAAHALFVQYRDAGSMEADRRVTIQGMIDGNPPYDQKELEDQGLADITNVNFMSMRAILDTRAGAAQELIMEVPALIEVRPVIPDKSDMFLDEHCRVISEEFSEMVLAWPGFAVAMDLSFRESDAFGIGFCLWPDEDTWRMKAFKRGSLLFDPAASVDLTANDIYMVRDTMSAGDLLEKMMNPEQARDEGWNVSGISETLRKVFIAESEEKSDDKYQRSVLESLQQMRRNNDPMYQSKQFQRVKIVHLLCREVSGNRGVSHMIIPDSESNKVFLFEQAERYQSMSQALWWLPFNYGDGFAASVRGVASWLAQHDDLSNRFLCRAFDSGFMSSSLLLQPQSQMDLGRLQFIQVGPYTVAPAGLNIIQSSFQPQISQAIQLRNVSEDIMKNNTGTYRQNPETFGDGGIQKTARQVAEESSRDARVEKAAVSHRYNQYEFLYREMFRRAVRLGLKEKGSLTYDGDTEARTFVQRCLDREVPRELLADHEHRLSIFATRAIGMGSIGIRMDITNQLMGIRGVLDTEGQNVVTRDYIAARVGQRNVGRYSKPYNRDMIPSSEHSFVALENNDLLLGQAVVVGNDQLHKIHVIGHVQAVTPIMQAVLQGQIQEPEKMFQQVQVTGQHIGEHANTMAQDPAHAQFLEQLKPFFKQVDEVMRVLEQLIKKLQRQQQKLAQEQQQVVQGAQQKMASEEYQAKVYEINKKAEIEAIKQKSLNDMRAQKTAEQMRISRERAAADIQLKGQRQAADIELERLAAASKLS